MSDSERTGPHPVVAATRNEGNLVLNTKTIAIIVAALLGGTVGGGGISLAATKEPQTAPAVTSALLEVNTKLNQITVTLAEMKTELQASSRENSKRDDTLGDHEQRLRKIEDRLRAR